MKKLFVMSTPCMVLSSAAKLNSCLQAWDILLGMVLLYSQGSFKLQGSTESKVSTGLPVLTLRFGDFLILLQRQYSVKVLQG